MAITWYEWLDYSQIKYTDNCICDIPMHDKNDLNDKVGIHNFKVINNWKPFYTGEEEDVFYLKKYYDEALYQSEHATSTALRKSCTRICDIMTGSATVDDDYVNLYDGSGTNSSYAYSDDGGLLIPSRGDRPDTMGGIGTSTALKNTYKYSLDGRGLSCNSSETVRTTLNYVPTQLNNPKTGIPYKHLTFKLQWFYTNAHRFFCINSLSGLNAAENSNNELTHCFIYNGSMTARIYSFYTTTTTSGISHSGRTSKKSLKSHGAAYWWNMTVTYSKADDNNKFGGFVRAYIDQADFFIELPFETSAGKPLYNPFTGEKNFTLVGIYEDADYDKRAYNKNYIRKLQIFDGLDYEQTATEPMKFMIRNYIEWLLTIMN